MTFEKLVAGHLEERGLWPEDVPAVMVEVKEVMKDTMSNRWADPVADYPPMLQAALLLMARSVAHAWLLKNQPNAWYLPMFAPPG
jgi:hypothetical protein